MTTRFITHSDIVSIAKSMIGCIFSLSCIADDTSVAGGRDLIENLSMHFEQHDITLEELGMKGEDILADVEKLVNRVHEYEVLHNVDSWPAPATLRTDGKLPEEPSVTAMFAETAAIDPEPVTVRGRYELLDDAEHARTTMRPGQLAKAAVAEEAAPPSAPYYDMFADSDDSAKSEVRTVARPMRRMTGFMQAIRLQANG